MHASDYRKPIPAWAAEDRPREKMVAKGTYSLTDAELVAMLLATGTKQHSAIDLARHLIRHFDGLNNLARATASELMKVKGIGQAKATTIIAAFELARRRLANDEQPTCFSGATALARYLVPKIGDKVIEVFYVIYLDRQNRLIAEEELFKGGTSIVAVDGKYMFKQAINHCASSIVVSHNHPSGRSTPSRSDDELTEHLLGLAQIVGITLLDHIVVARKGWYSYADQGLLKPLREQSETNLVEASTAFQGLRNARGRRSRYT